MYQAAALLYPGALVSSIALPKEILQAASQMASLTHQGRTQVSFQMAGYNTQTVESGSGIQIRPDIRYTDLGQLDLLLLPAMWRNPRLHLRKSGWVLSRLQEYVGAGTLICSVGTGSFFLAEAGILDNRPAITHWRYMDQFARNYPRIELKRRHLITQSDNIYCVGSVNSVADLMVHIVENWFGTRVSTAVANQFSPEIRLPFRFSAYQHNLGSAHHDESIVELQLWLERNYQKPGTPKDWSDKAGVSVRTLNRRFKLVTNMTPVTYIRLLRMNQAQELLRHSNLSISEIAWQVGIQDASYFARQFQEYAGITARAYRKMAKGKLFEAGSPAAITPVQRLSSTSPSAPSSSSTFP